MKKRGKWLTAMGLAMLLTLQTPVAAVVEASTDGGIQQEMTVENQKGTKEDRDESEVQSEEQSEKQSDLEIQKNDITDEERTEVIPQEASQMSESVKKEQIIYTWKYDAEIGWQLWKSEGEEEEKICAPGVYILKDGIYYLGVYETEDKEVSRIKEEEPEQGVLKEGMVSVTDTTPVITDEEKEIILQEGTYYFSYETGGEEESQQPRDGKYLTNTWVHPGEDVSVWYYVNKEGVQEDPALHEGPMQNETGYFYLDKQGKSQSGKFKINGVIYNYDGKGNRSQIRDGWQQDGNNWYYIENGQQATGWKNLQSNWYYLNPQNGILQKGVFRDYTGTLYYADSNGRMISGNGWKQIGTA
jgi:glucan-binding YG repeat protein